MNVNTIIVTREEAERKLDAYRALRDRQRTEEDDKLESLYKRVKEGGRVINLVNAFGQTGLNEKDEPRLAIAAADWRTVYFHRHWHSYGFSRTRVWNKNATRLNITLPGNTFDRRAVDKVLYSPVPHVPPNVRPRFALSNYHILFEVKEWKTYPVDPFLLRHIDGYLYVVEAEWELTELEAMLLGAMAGIAA